MEQSLLNTNTNNLIGLRNMFSKVNQCLTGGLEYGLQCSSAVIEKNIRQLPFIKNLIYPWRNYDWDYSQYVKNYYEPKQLGASGKGNIKALIKDVNALMKIIDGLIIDANPNNKSKASDINRKNDLAKCYKTASRVSCYLLNKTKSSYLSQKPPYDHSFFKKPIDGSSSSSFYTQIGICPTKINNKKACLKKGGQWIENPFYKLPELLRGPDSTPGNCFLGRYAYIDNRPGLNIGNIKNMNGIIPSIANDMLKLSPDKLMAVAMGNGVDGVDLQKCEPFIVKKNSKSNIKNIICIVLLLYVIMYIFKYYCKNIGK